MDALKEFFEEIKKHKHPHGNLLGLLHVMIGRRISRADGAAVSAGLSWRSLANWLKKIRWDTECARELGVDPEKLSPKDRERFWYTVIARAAVDSEKAAKAGDRFAEVLRKNQYEVSERPGKS